MVAIKRRYFQVDGCSENANAQVLGMLECIVAKYCCKTKFPTGHTHMKISVMHCLLLYSSNLTISNVQLFRCCFCSGLEMDAEEQGYKYASLL